MSINQNGICIRQKTWAKVEYIKKLQTKVLRKVFLILFIKISSEYDKIFQNKVRQKIMAKLCQALPQFFTDLSYTSPSIFFKFLQTHHIPSVLKQLPTATYPQLCESPLTQNPFLSPFLFLPLPSGRDSAPILHCGHRMPYALNTCYRNVGSIPPAVGKWANHFAKEAAMAPFPSHETVLEITGSGYKVRTQGSESRPRSLKAPS